jgi:hypothetical protein
VAPMMQRRFADLDDEDVLDDFDPKYFPKRVYKNGRGPKVSLMLTDAMPPEYRAAISRRPTGGAQLALYDASAHRPRYADLTDARLQDGLRKAAEARDAWVRGLQDA